MPMSTLADSHTLAPEEGMVPEEDDEDEDEEEDCMTRIRLITYSIGIDRIGYEE